MFLITFLYIMYVEMVSRIAYSNIFPQTGVKLTAPQFPKYFLLFLKVAVTHSISGLPFSAFFFFLFHGTLPFSGFLPILKNLYQATGPFEHNQEWAQISSATSILSGSCSRESLGITTRPSFPVLFWGSASAHSDASLDKISSPSSATKSLNLFHGCKASDKTGHVILMSMSCFQPSSSQTITKYFPISQAQTLPALPSLCL